MHFRRSVRPVFATLLFGSWQSAETMKKGIFFTERIGLTELRFLVKLSAAPHAPWAASRGQMSYVVFLNKSISTS